MTVRLSRTQVKPSQRDQHSLTDKANMDKSEWTRYYRLPVCNSIEALHARFVTHRYPRHAHDYLVIGLVERGAQAYWYRGERHITPAGQVFLVNTGEPHTGESATPDGYVYRTLYPQADLMAQIAGDLGIGSLPHFKGAVLNDPALVSILSRLHRRLTEQG